MSIVGGDYDDDGDDGNDSDIGDGDDDFLQHHLPPLPARPHTLPQVQTSA